MSRQPFTLILISAWNDSGGGFLHRLFDGHPECFVYPFELQLGTTLLHDGFESWFRAKYRWPLLPADLAASRPDELFELFIDDEVKSYLRGRGTSKFREFDLQLASEDWRREFRARLAGMERTPEAVVAAYVDGLFATWRNRRASGRERMHVGHCPVIVLDADRILAECPGARLIHVVRRPTTGFVDMRRRVPEVEVASYCRKWSLVNMLGFYFAEKYPDRMATVRLDRLIDDRASELRRLCAWLGLAYDVMLEVPTWNGEPLAAMGPFGGVPVVSAAHERECEASLSFADRAVIEEKTRAVQALYGLAGC
jgi:Sulfotransferase family